jgi:hypothetical protein
MILRRREGGKVFRVIQRRLNDSGRRDPGTIYGPFPPLHIASW